MTRTHLRTLPAITLAAFVLATSTGTSAQAPAAPPPEGDNVAVAVANAARTAASAEHSAPLFVANRYVTELRATVLSRSPATRATAAADLIGRLIEQTPEARVTTHPYEQGVLVRVADQPVLVIFQADVDPLQGEAWSSKASDAAARLQVAIDETGELRRPGRLIRAIALAASFTVLYVGVLWVVLWVDRRAASRLARSAEQRLLNLPGGEALVRAADAPRNIHRVFALVSFIAGALLTYTWLTAVLRRFPYTRPWGESLRGWLVALAFSAGRRISEALPDLFVVLLIVLVTRFLIKLAAFFFAAVEQGRMSISWIHPETALPTRRIVTALLWLFALIVSYPYLPGSDSEAFKGVSVFVGLVISLGSTGVMNQVMSGLMLTYSRAIKCGDFVKVANIEGTVTSLGTLAARVTTPRNEEVTIPNSLVVSDATINYSRNAANGVMTSTSVTIGYDTPWRQVHALLQLAASRTDGVRAEPKPLILQAGLQDFYVNYYLFVALQDPHRRFFVLAKLHENIQDAFNEYGVQIMSPHYLSDPAAPKVVAPDHWFEAPATPTRGVGV